MGALDGRFNDNVIITSVDYDHPDSFPTEADYKEEFLQPLAEIMDNPLHMQQTYLIINP